jgi:hypothetical protein
MHFNPIWNAIRDQDEQMLMKPESRVDRWKGYGGNHHTSAQKRRQDKV